MPKQTVSPNRLQSYKKIMDYAKYIHRCLQIARNGAYYVAPNPMVGAILVRNADEKVLSEGWHQQYGGPHAEVNCLRTLPNPPYKGGDLGDCTLFVNLEPCSHYGKTPPCAKLLIDRGVGRVVIGMQDPNEKVAGRGIQMLREAGIEVIVGVEEEACRELNKRFICLHEKKRPYVVLKWAQSSDGFVDNRNYQFENYPFENLKIATPPLVLSTPLTKQLVHQMRAENMAIMVGTHTALADNPRLLTTRWSGRNPIRVVLDRKGVLPAESKIFSGEAETIVYREQTDWAFVLQDLANRGIHSVLVEGGPTLHKHILESGVWDEIHVEVAPEVACGKGTKAPCVGLPTEGKQIDGHICYMIRNKR